MAIITDPDQLTRESVIFGTATQQVSIYPVGSTQRGDASPAFANNAWVSNTSNIVRESGAWTGVVNGDVVCILYGPDAGHYYVNNNISTSSIDLTRIIDGNAGATTSTGLTVSDFTAQNANVHSGNNSLEITAHGLITGDAFVLDNATAPTGLTDGVVYYVMVNDANFIRLSDTYDNALANTSEQTFSDSGTGDTDFHERVGVTVFTNGAAAVEQLSGANTSGDATGTLVDGVTKQAAYSYGKEEWRLDSIDASTSNTYYNDDLIRHEFPFEAITAEQFEIGGGASHQDWGWFDTYTRKKVRTAGWAEKNETGSPTNDLERQAGIITLGSLDSDTQVYYQQTNATTTPVNFTFLGAINEAIRIYYDANQDGSADFDYLTYLKLFARKKGKTYVQSEIADIGVSSLQTIVNRFPLAHADDAAISNTDGEILGLTPFRTTTLNASVTDAIDGDITAGGVTFTDADATFETWLVVAGDTLRVTNGNDVGYYTIASVDSDTVLTIATDFEFTGWQDTTSSATYEIYSYYRIADKATTPGTAAVYSDGAIADVDGDTGTMTDSTNSPFTVGSGVAPGDYLLITEVGAHYGLYEVISRGSDTVITVNTSDQIFTSLGTIDYMVLNAGMYLLYKKDTVTNAAPTSYDFDDTNASYGNRPTITRSDGTWDAALVSGSIIEITGSESTGENDGSYTVHTVESTTIISLVATDVIVDNATDTTAVMAVYNGFIRDIGGTNYAFNWRLSGNDSTLANCYQFIQHQLRQTIDIDYGDSTFRGDITDLLMSFASPTGTTLNMYIDDLDTNDINNTTFQDHSGVNRNSPFVAAGSLSFNLNLSTDTDAKYWLFFENDDAGDNLGRDYGTEYAIIVEDATSPTPLQIAGAVPQQAGGSTVAFTYDYDGNVQRGDSSAGVDAPVTLVAIGLETAQFVISTGTIGRTTGITISAVAALERNYLDP